MTMQQSAPSQDFFFAFGLGYSAEALARRLLARGWACSGTVRSAERAVELAMPGADIQVFSGAERVDIEPGAHWLVSVPPAADGCPIFAGFQDAAREAATITYLSTTGVYGDLQGGWAFEWTTPAPRSERAKRRVLAEDQWASLGVPFRTVRLPGIYGPGRSVLDRLRKGTARAIVKDGQVFSRVHVDDIASGLEAMMLRPEATGVFHLCDDVPAAPHLVTEYGAQLLGMDVPERVAFEAAEMSQMGRSFYAECKRVSNARAKSALGWFPKYRSYKEGLAAILAAEGKSPS